MVMPISRQIVSPRDCQRKGEGLIEGRGKRGAGRGGGSSAAVAIEPQAPFESPEPKIRFESAFGEAGFFVDCTVHEALSVNCAERDNKPSNIPPKTHPVG